MLQPLRVGDCGMLPGMRNVIGLSLKQLNGVTVHRASADESSAEVADERRDPAASEGARAASVLAIFT
jgi:hypothetical protein